MKDDFIITMTDIRNCRICSDGARRFFIRHGFNWSDFVTNGIEASKLLETGDAIAEQVVEKARG